MKKEFMRVYMTDDFDSFKIINGNRKDIDRRKHKIEKSVKMVGYIPAPIIVNEKMEIIDGQARFAYCKEHNIPIAYCVIEGLTVDDCIAMNVSSSNWKIMDYIDSYVDRGFRSYILAKRFILNSPYGFNATIWALMKSDSANLGEAIKNGNLSVSQDDYESGMDIIEFWRRFDDIKTNRKNEFLKALGYCYLIPEVDNDILCRKIHLRPRDFQTIASTTDAIDVIEDAYNVRTRNHVYIETEYFKYLDNKSAAGNLSNIILGRRLDAKQKELQ